MTLDEAIKKCKEKAISLREEAQLFRNSPVYSESTISDCEECAREHEQLASWLNELKEYQALFDSPKEAEDLLNQFMV